MAVHAAFLLEQRRASPRVTVGRVRVGGRLEALIAAGGMGEVYRARDTRLDRIVAIKMLPEYFADDPDRRERFQREAKIVSSLNHPHICALYDVGMHDGAYYLVMEYIDGETLHDRIQRGAVPVAEALPALMHIADALDRAHRRGIVHRDLKPGNVMWTKSGVKLLDFGLAARRSRDDRADSDRATSERSRALTAEGTVLGTVQYMAPEQLQGLAADARTDIFAFGVLAYEMLTGRHAFEGNSHAALITAILRDEPKPLPEVVPEIPASLARTLSRCYAKDPDERWQSASDLLFQLQSLTTLSAPIAVAAAPSRQWSAWVERGLWLGLAAVATIVGAGWVPRGGSAPEETAVPPSLVFSVPPPRGWSLAGLSTPFALSPDGKSLAYVAAGDDGIGHLWLRSLDVDRERLLPGTEGAHAPFWSADSQWIGFFAARTLKKVRASTGVSQIVARDVMTTGGASWGAHDDIIFPGSLQGLTRIAADGRMSRVNVEPGNQFSPQFLSDGRHFIYSATSRNAFAVASLDGGSPRTVMSVNVGTSPVAYARGYVFFVQDGALLARPFDEQRFEFTGDAKPLATGIPAVSPSLAPFAVSNSGVLAYWTTPLGRPAVLTWIERDGRASIAIDTPARYRGFSLSPDGERVVFSRMGKMGTEDLWLRHWRDKNETPITFNGAAFLPLWSPDGAEVAYAGFGVRPPPNVYVKSLRSDREASLVGSSSYPAFATGWTPDGQTIVVGHVGGLPGHTDLWNQPRAGGPEQRLWFNTPANENQGRVSPDGNWIAYVTDESGSLEVWLASYPSGTVKRQVSRAGGSSPEWGPNEVFFIDPNRQLMAARVTAGPAGPQVATAQVVARIPTLIEVEMGAGPASNPFAVSSDGQRFLVAQRAHDPNAAPITVVVNWPALLKR
jgi:serine/threonine protein kinase